LNQFIGGRGRDQASRQLSARFYDSTADAGIRLKPRGFDLDSAKHGWMRGLGRLEMQFQRFLQIRQSLLLGLALAGDIDFKALRYMPFAFAPYGSYERSFHAAPRGRIRPEISYPFSSWANSRS